uniref:Modular domain immune-type receptor n=1 Tax=Rostroraja eglanteria TaxID=3360502 RepID=A0S0E7_ROSEG|nr:modular domain immune-type receptor [Raja eglanteria]
MDFVFLYFMITFSVTNAALSGPRAVNGTEGQSVQITCTYDRFYSNFPKYWCKGSDWSRCTILVQTIGRNMTTSDGRISITDDTKVREFSVTMEHLTLNDEGWYWCGIMRVFIDLRSRVKLNIIENTSPAKDIWKHNTNYYVIWNIMRWIFLVILLVWGIVTARM